MGYRWVVLAIGTAAQAAFSAVYLGVGVLAPELQRRYGLELGQAGIPIAAVNAGSVSTLLAWGLLSDRVGERLVIALGLGVSGTALVAAAQAPSLGWLVATLFASGAGGACVMSATGRAVASWFERHQRGLALGVRQTGVPVGGALASLTLPAIVAGGGVDAAFYVLAGLCLLAATMGAVGLREPPADNAATEAVKSGAKPFRDRRIWVLSLGGALLACAQASIVGFTVLFLHSTRDLSLARAAAALATMQLLGTVGRIALGHLSDRLDDRLGPLVAMAAAISVALAVAAALAQASLAVLISALVCAGGLALSWNGLAFTATVELAGHLQSGSALGVQQSAIAATNALIPLLFAPLVVATSWQVAFALAAAPPLAAAVLLWPLARAQWRTPS